MRKTLELEHAIYYGDYHLLVSIIENQPEMLNVRFEANLSLTPLMWACRNRRDSMVDYLLSKGALVNERDRLSEKGEGSNTALWYTAQGSSTGNVNIAKKLIDSGAEIDAICEFGTTALFMAASWFHLDLVQFLIDKGANHQLKDIQGRSIVEMLKEDLVRIESLDTRNDDEERYLDSMPRMINFFEALPSA